MKYNKKKQKQNLCNKNHNLVTAMKSIKNNKEKTKMINKRSKNKEINQLKQKKMQPRKPTSMKCKEKLKNETKLNKTQHQTCMLNITSNLHIEKCN